MLSTVRNPHFYTLFAFGILQYRRSCSCCKKFIKLHEMTRLHVRSCADEHATTTQQLSGWLEQNIGATPGAGAYTVSHLPVLTTTIQLINQSINLFFQLRGQRHTKCILQTRHAGREGSSSIQTFARKIKTFYTSSIM